MSTVPISPLLGVTDAAAVRRSFQGGANRPPAQAAAEQFEAILVRQLLGDALKPMFGAGEGAVAGNNVYQYLVTDVVAQSVAQGGGLGIAKMLVPQLTPKGLTTDKPETTS
ncbi:MAG TPA: rod-binding protein [Opitutaceae bacterium]|nr:rod-binding protein [Opitutaceae bacterium]